MFKTYYLLLSAIMSDSEEIGEYEEIADPDNIIFGIKFDQIYPDCGGRALCLDGAKWSGNKYESAYIDMISQKVAFGNFEHDTLKSAIEKWNSGKELGKHSGITIATFIAPLTNIITS